jgi:threonine/homoserine/homoserine lactone efflux protein
MHVLPFLVVAVIVVVTPGVDMALVTKNALVHGRRAALATAFGVNVGIALWTLAAALGIAAVVRASAEAFDVVKFAGAVYLVYLGIQSLRRRERGAVARRRMSPFRQGLISNALNPKIAVFFTSLLPQFVDAEHAHPLDLLLLGLLFNCIGVAWLLAYAELAARGRDVLRRPRVKRALDRVSGIALVALGVRLAFERR